MMQTIKNQNAVFVSEGFILQFLVKTPAVTVPVKKAIILLHGVGGNEENLLGFSDLLPEFLIISPRGPIKRNERSYAWFDVNFSTGKPIINPTQEAESRTLLIAFIKK
jgi:phospholipase/carboxylesterase